MQIKSNQSYCIFCRKAIILFDEDKNQYHNNCWSAVKDYKSNSSPKHEITNKIGNIAKNIHLSIHVNIYHGLIRKNLGILTVIPKRSLIYSAIFYLSLAILFLFLI